ncbi:MAG: endonuclease MutS2 [Chloroflexota bacterium]
MDPKTLSVLEYHKILEHLAAHCDFSASAELARSLRPVNDYDQAVACLAETSEASRLLSTRDMTIGGAHDVREQVDLAARGGVLDPQSLLDVQSTLVSCRDLRRSFERLGDEYPHLVEIALRLPAPSGLVEAISRTIADNGEVLDSASQKLAALRREVRIAHDRLTARLQKYLTDPKTAPKLQDTVITQRDGRYVIPLRAEFKGQIKSVIHDQSSTGATLFVEPLAVVELNNAYRESQLAERDEVRRILAELSAQVGDLAAEIIPGVNALAQLDLAFAKAKYADAIQATAPILHPFPRKPSPDANERSPAIVCRLLQARHPLLDPQGVVPIDMDAAPGIYAVIITGPNTGGKTVTLKTVGLLALMAQSGLHIPAQSGSELACFRNVYADIGDEQSIEQSLSTFSGHITNIIQIIKRADHQTLVILDELGAGTDPQEGAALARAILTFLLERGISTFVATHYPELKTFAHSTPGVVNASLEFDIRTLRPTYKLTLGLPGRSNALAIAQRLGLPEEIIAAARNEINPDNLRADRLIGDIHRQRNSAHKERQKAEKARAEVHRLRRELTERFENIEEERLAILEKARLEAEAQVDALQAEVQELKRQMQKKGQPLEAVEAIIEQAKTLEEQVPKAVIRKQAPFRQPQGPLMVGENVTLRTLGTPGVISAIEDDEAEVQAGQLRLRVKLGDLLRKRNEQEPATANQAKPSLPRQPAGARPSTTYIPASPGLELDLRGQASDDALEVLDRYIDQAYLAGLPYVRIIHGKGTGKLRQEVRAALKQHPQIHSFEEGGAKEGGEGVTVAKLISG